MPKSSRRIDDAFSRMLSPRAWENIQALQEEQGRAGFDPFGFEPVFLRFVAPVCEWLLRTYFDADITGLEHVPDDGPVMLIANHSGQVPVDGLLIATSCLLVKSPPRMIRGMVERWVPDIPFISWIFSRVGQVVGTRENARILLRRGGCVMVFPEGTRGISKTFDKAYRLERFGLGFMRLALETNTPIVPVGVVGAEEQMPSVANLTGLGSLLGMPAFPVTPTWPLLGPLGALPLPVRYRISFGEPMTFEGDPDDEDRVIRAQVHRVTQAIENLITSGLNRREGVFL